VGVYTGVASIPAISPIPTFPRQGGRGTCAVGKPRPETVSREGPRGVKAWFPFPLPLFAPSRLNDQLRLHDNGN
jgi:hypothetical protein